MKKTSFSVSDVKELKNVLNMVKKMQKKEKQKKFEIILSSGTYFLSEPLEITGIKNVTFTGKGKVTISGGRKIKDVVQKEMNGLKLWVFECEKSTHNLWINGKRVLRSRYPKNSFLKVKGVIQQDSEKKWNEPVDGFVFYPGSIKKWKSFKNSEVVLMTRWIECRRPVKEIDEENCHIYFTHKSIYKPDPDDLYYVENLFEFLEPNSWYYDSQEKKIYYCPLETEKIDEAEIIAGFLPEIIRIKNCKDLDFKNICFSHSDWYYDEGFPEKGFNQAANGLPGAIYCENARNIVFEKCEFSHLGQYGLEFGKGCQKNQVINCTFYDLGGGGIKIGETIIRRKSEEKTHSNIVKNCVIDDGGIIFHQAVGIWIGHSYNNKISSNEISNLYYTGISIGWTWGYKKSGAFGNRVENNTVHHIGKKQDGSGPILSDMGGIYTLGIQPGTVIRNNIFYHIAAIKYGGWGIYFDEGSTDIVAENNIVFFTTHGGFHQHYGKNNIVRKNIFAFGRDVQITLSRPENHLRVIFENNTVIGNTEKFLGGNIDFNFIFQKNVYIKIGSGTIKFGEYDWSDWQKKNMDVNSKYICLNTLLRFL